MSILLYADDILLVAPSLQQLLHVCEQELARLDTSLNVKKSACMHVGGRFNAKCASTVTRERRELSWVNNIRYVGIYIESVSSFKCSVDAAKRSLFCSFNAILWNLDELPQMKYYSLEACTLGKSQYRPNSIDCVTNSSFRKLYDIGSRKITDVYLGMLNCPPTQQLLPYVNMF